ncbi:MAG: hypothetical protein ABIL40_02250 [candidate division WOR-3 bacterium]
MKRDLIKELKSDHNLYAECPNVEDMWVLRLRKRIFHLKKK